MSAFPPNPVLKKLGFANTDRVAILHADDVGFCQASMAAFAELWDFGLISCGAVMVPCPWFPLAAEFARTHPQADLGIHSTLTCEYNYYRWGPISTRDPASGLLDEQGYFPHRSQQTQAMAVPEAAARELEAQVERALQFGMKPSHIDTHMGTVLHFKFMLSYIQLGWKYHLPLMVPRLEQSGLQAMGADPETAAMAVSALQSLESTGFPLLDHLSSLPLDRPGQRLEQAKAALAALKPGVTHFLFHPAKDTPELRAITPDWQCRVQDYETFLSDDLRQFIKDQGIQVIGYRELQKLMPA